MVIKRNQIGELIKDVLLQVYELGALRYELASLRSCFLSFGDASNCGLRTALPQLSLLLSVCCQSSRKEER